MRRSQRYFPSQRDSLLVVALSLSLAVMGCAHNSRTMSKMVWNAATQGRWSGSQGRWPGYPMAEPKGAEPSVTANAAASRVSSVAGGSPSDGVTKADSSRPSASGSASPVPSDQISTASGTMTPQKPDAVSAAGGDLFDDELGESPNAQTLTADTTAEQVERLKAALDDDAERAKQPPRPAASSHEVRVRVDSMLDRARRLFDLGQLREARHTAKIAHDLGHSARLDYSPDEERPIDLVQRIDDQLKESEAQTEPEGTAPSESSATPPPAVPLPAAPTSAPPAAVSAAASRDAKPHENEQPRSRRDWSYGLNKFRKDKKPTEPTTGNAVVATAPTRTDAETTAPQVATDAGANPNDGPEQAVVQANRSLTLIKAEQPDVRAERFDRDSSAPIAVIPYQRNISPEDTEDSNPASSDVETRADEESSDVEPIDRTWPREITSPTPRPANDDPAPMPVEFEEVKPLTPFRDVAAPATAESAESLQVETPRNSNSGILWGLAAFGACAIVAFICYRRGAT